MKRIIRFDIVVNEDETGITPTEGTVIALDGEGGLLLDQKFYDLRKKRIIIDWLNTLPTTEDEINHKPGEVPGNTLEVIKII